ncbi:hypothetical protein V1514DRAFT_336768 [Lipomyces japonicus]|uniref:uncharacterized protein n=1 Tax=Lipomyces japonicus TaxID=56871 RepID=UPI0034CE6080
MARGGKLTGLQKEVLNLYRAGLRAIRKKPEQNRHNFYIFQRRQFDEHRSISKSDFATIEYLVRRGGRTLELYSSNGVQNVNV